MAKTYKDFIAVSYGFRAVKDKDYGFVLAKLENGKTVSAICNVENPPARGEEIGVTETTEGKNKTYRVWQ